jgi:hypothetical protein
MQMALITVNPTNAVTVPIRVLQLNHVTTATAKSEMAALQIAK